MERAMHGGIFWEGAGHSPENLAQVVRADVLDACFPPAPEILELFSRHGMELTRTSPPAYAEPLIAALSATKSLLTDSILVGAGSSALIHSCVPFLARNCETAIILNPTYSEYRHVITTKTSCRLTELAKLTEVDTGIYLLVNPNSPNGRLVPQDQMKEMVAQLSQHSIVWIDETYMEYAGAANSLEDMAAENDNVIVCKSMSKIYALSGLRVAYLVSSPKRIAQLKKLLPPWAVGSFPIFAAIEALSQPAYYENCYEEMRRLRSFLSGTLSGLNLYVEQGDINCVLATVDTSVGLTADDIVQRCRESKVYLRSGDDMGDAIGPRTFRVSVRPENEILLIEQALQKTLS